MVSRYFSSRRTLSALLTQTLSALPAAAGGRRLTCLPDVSAGRNATRIALGAGDAGVMDAGEWVVLDTIPYRGGELVRPHHLGVFVTLRAGMISLPER